MPNIVWIVECPKCRKKIVLITKDRPGKPMPDISATHYDCLSEKEKEQTDRQGFIGLETSSEMTPSQRVQKAESAERLKRILEAHRGSPNEVPE